jgi:hypothetical protein
MNSAILDEVVRCVSNLGQVSEANLTKFLFLVCISNRLPEPIAALVSGLSSASIVERVLALIPENDYFRVSPASVKLLMDPQTSSLARDRIFVITDDEEERLELKPFRTLLRQYLSKVPIITTYLPNGIDANVSNRLLGVHTNESVSQTEAMLERECHMATPEGMIEARRGEILSQTIQETVRRLKNYEVAIPFAGEIDFPTSEVRARQDLQQFLRLIQAVALLNQKDRRKDESDLLLATPDDYAIARTLIVDLCWELYSELTAPELELLTAMKQELNACRGPEKRLPRGPETFDHKKLKHLTRQGRRWIDARLQPLIQMGYIYQETRGRKVVFELVEDLVDSNPLAQTMPPIEALTENKRTVKSQKDLAATFPSQHLARHGKGKQDAGEVRCDS